MTKREQLFALVEERASLHKRLGEIDAEIDDLFGEGTTRPGRRPTTRKEASSGGSSNGASGSRPPPEATNGHRVRQPSEQAQEAEAMAKDGKTPKEIAELMGLKGRSGLVKVTNYIYRARKAGRLPKAEASR